MQVESRVSMTRRVVFSSGHRYWITSLSPEENRIRFGDWASPYNHGHNYRLGVTVAGEIHPVTGMIVNIKTVDDILQSRIVRVLDQKSINDEIAYFRDKSPSLENLMIYLASILGDDVLPPETKLTGLILEESDTLFGEYRCENGPWTMTLTRTYEFAAAHRLHVPQMTIEQNHELFGKCNNPAGHGHNYVLEVTVEGEPDPKTGMMVDLGQLDKIVEELVVDRYDHKHLNEDVPEFKDKTPTSEVIAREIFDRLEGRLPATLNRVRLHETARNIFEVSR